MNQDNESVTEPGLGSRVRHIKRAERVMRFHMPRANEPGYQRILCEGISATSVTANVLVLPFGQGCPQHIFTAEVIVFVVEGEVEFKVSDNSYHLGLQDFFYIPAGTWYEYRNVGTGQATFLSVGGRVSEWPGISRYEGVNEPVVVH